MHLFNGEQKYFGLFETHSLLMVFDGDMAHHENILSKFDPTSTGNYRVQWNKLTEDEQSALLTQVHERDHFKQFISTPFGILIWRCYQVIIRDINNVLSFFKQRNRSVTLNNLPLLDWWKQTGTVMYNEFRDEDNNYLEDYVIPELEGVYAFVEIMTSAGWEKRYSTYTVGQFIQLVNYIYPLLARRSGLAWRTTWNTKLPLDTPLFGQESCNFNVLAIFEGLSRLREHITLLKNELITPIDIEEWKKKNLFSYYEIAYSYAIKHYLPPGLEQESRIHLGHAHSVLTTSLFGNIDITCDRYFAGVFFIEHEFPWFRAKALTDPDIVGNFYQQTIETSGFILSKNEIFSSFSNWDSREFMTLDIFLTASQEDQNQILNTFDSFTKYRARHFRLVERYFFAGVDLMYQSLVTGTSVGNQLDELALIQEYSDQLFFTNTPAFDKHEMFVSIMISLHVGYIQHVLLCLLTGQSIIDPTIIGKKLSKSIRRISTGLNYSPTEEELVAFEGFFSKEMIQYFIPVEIDKINWINP